VLRNTGRSSLIINDDEGAEDDSSEWIMSYADTVTLLLCFFIIFFAESNKDKEQDILDQVMMALNPPATKTQEEQSKGEGNRQQAAMLSQLEGQLKERLHEFEVKKVNMGIERRRKEILLRLYEKDFFHIGSWNLKPKGKQVLKSVAEMVKPFEDAVLIKIEGHSDSLPVNPLSSYKTNLNLSSLRASKAANVLISNSIKEDKIRVVGFGSANILVPDRNPASLEYIPENGKKNRRIEVRIQVNTDAADQYINLVF